MGRVALPAGYSVRQAAYPRYFARRRLRVSTKCVCVRVRACVHKYHYRASPRQQV
jgi:hypothetical protein